MRLAYAPVMLKFRQPAGTSRGVLYEKPTYLLKIWNEKAPEMFGIGEASVFPGLSPEADGRYEYKIVELLANIALGRSTTLSGYSSLQLGLEEAIRDYSSGGKGIYFDSPFVHGKAQIAINGLIWMGNFKEMEQRVAEKLEAGFKCLKFKIGALDWQGELEMLRAVRKNFSAKELEIRVDANGGFPISESLKRLEDLATLEIHSIEQPIPANHWEEMAEICKHSPVKIALDEELIGISDLEERERMLDKIRPDYIILKPSLCGGFNGSDIWIEMAEVRGIGWWITSALESNVGLDAIAQYAASKGVTMPQGLGTGGLYVENFVTPISLQGEYMTYNPTANPDRRQYETLDWRY
ncbi:MAG: o-succinylbenzoate synthase [Clostridium sp.]|nr:o-succinylbenzoate synthase [Prevotella sp.]MCM1428709.1 o-succinylbenzoate synthase [Clostridium sp.]